MKELQSSHQLFLELTRCEIWGREINTSLFEEVQKAGGIEWSKVLRIAKEQAMLGVVANSIAKLPASLQPDRATQFKLHKRVTINRQQYNYQLKVLDEVLADLQSVGVPRGVLLKGFGVARNYPDPSARMCGDIDLFVGDAMYQRATEICADSKYHETPRHFEFHYKNVPLEIHRSVTSGEEITVDREALIEWFDNVLFETEHTEMVDINGYSVEVPDATFNAVYIFIHAYHHLVKGGIGLRQICDWALVLDRQAEQIDYRIVEDILDRHDLRVMWDIFIRMIEKYLDFDVSKCPLESLARAHNAKLVMGVVLERGNFGQYAQRGSQSKNFLIKQLQTFGTRVSELGFLLRIDMRRGFKTMANIVREGVKSTIKQLFGD